MSFLWLSCHAFLFCRSETILSMTFWFLSCSVKHWDIVAFVRRCSFQLSLCCREKVLKSCQTEPGLQSSCGSFRASSGLFRFLQEYLCFWEKTLSVCVFIDLKAAEKRFPLSWWQKGQHLVHFFNWIYWCFFIWLSCLCLRFKTKIWIMSAWRFRLVFL